MRRGLGGLRGLPLHGLDAGRRRLVPLRRLVLLRRLLRPPRARLLWLLLPAALLGLLVGLIRLVRLLRALSAAMEGLSKRLSPCSPGTR